MTIKSVYDKQDDIPEVHRPLFTERSGKWELTGIEGVKPEAAFAAVQEGLRKERTDHSAAKTALKPFTDLGKTPEEIHEILDKLPQLQLAAEGKVKELTDAQKAALTAPLDRSIKKLSTDNETLAKENTTLKAEKKQRIVHDSVRAAATEMKVLAGAVDDVLMYANAVFEVTDDGKVVVKDGVGFTAGIDAKSWLQDFAPKKAHWWPPSQGGGAGGSGPGSQFGGVNNPWKKEHWNMTEQGKMVTSLGLDKATEMAKAVGSFIGAVAPPADKK